MALLSEIDFTGLIDLHNRIYEDTAKFDCLEDVAQEYTNTLYNGLSESIALVRIFLTVPFAELPNENKQFVQHLVGTAGLTEKLTTNTPVLSLVGTSGGNPEWNDRKNSKGHVGIPLLSASFIDSIPMMSRMLNQFGAGFDWVDSDDSKFVQAKVGSFAGSFYVRDAKNETDNQGRKIIAAQDFVNKNNIKTVFGFGGAYLGSKTFFTVIVFLHETVDEKVVEWFKPQASKFKAATMKMVNQGRIFS